MNLGSTMSSISLRLTRVRFFVNMQNPVVLLITFTCLFGADVVLAEDEKIQVNSITVQEEGIWGPVLEELATSNFREKRVLTPPAIPTKFKASERISEVTDDGKKESKISPGKIINTNKKPSNGREVSETDIYLLGAIEKLVYKVDFMEKRLRKIEEMMYYVMAGSRMDTEPCPDNFTRAGKSCYLFSTNAGRELDWKAASKQCKKFGATLTEMETIEENQDVVAYIQSLNHLRGRDFWTGGLNPGLLWIWSNSARPVPTNVNKNGTSSKLQSEIFGEGRCLRLAYNPGLRTYAYRGTDCSYRHNYICELKENTSANEVFRIGRKYNVFNDEL